ncbi:MAG: TatD family hydrolase [Desulfonatronovibrionaceae bacterium]
MTKKCRPLPEEMALPLGGADSHAHLDLENSGELEENLKLAYNCGISHIGQVFLGPEAYAQNNSMFDDREGVFFILGIHPHDAGKVRPGDISRIGDYIREDKKIRALGEIGLDYHYLFSPEQTQQDVFSRQLELAAQLDVPVVIHSRKAEKDTLRILEQAGFKDRKLLWHCFGQGPDMAREILERGWMVSVPGPVTYRKNHPLQEAVAKTLPLERILLETDCPFLSPEPYRGKKNHPNLLVFTARKTAELKGMEPETVWEKTGRNCREFFRLQDIPPSSGSYF